MRDFIDDALDFARFMAPITAAVVALVALALWGANAGMAADCRSKADRMGLAMDYGFIGGCMVEVGDGKWAPLESLRYVGGEWVTP